MTTWFISDTHLGDETLLKRRYSRDVDQFDAYLASRWDAKVTDDDEVWVLGDVARGRPEHYIADWFDARPGRKHLVLGNWDDPEADWWPFATVVDQIDIVLAHRILVRLSHYPYGHPKNPEFPMTLVHGHTHSPKKVKRAGNDALMLHVGWDAWRRMVSEQDLIDLIEKERESADLLNLRRAEHS